MNTAAPVAFTVGVNVPPRLSKIAPLVIDVANQYKSNRALYDITARDWTHKYASE